MMNFLDLKNFRLSRSSHATAQEGMCAMEAVAWLAGQVHSDRPAGVCPHIRNFVIAVNDNASDIERQRLIPYLHRLIGANGGNRNKRAAMVERRIHIRKDLAASKHFGAHAHHLAMTKALGILEDMLATVKERTTETEKDVYNLMAVNVKRFPGEVEDRRPQENRGPVALPVHIYEEVDKALRRAQDRAKFHAAQRELCLTG